MSSKFNKLKLIKINSYIIQKIELNIYHNYLIATNINMSILTGNASGTITTLCKSRTTLLSLLKLQGFKVDEYEQFGINEVHAMHINKQLDMTVEKDTGEKAYVKYHLGKPLRKDNIIDYVNDLFQTEKILTKTDALIIITKTEINDPTIAILSQLWEQEGFYLVVFSIDRLQFNLLEHSYVPKHTILNEAETKTMLMRYNVSRLDMLPNISRFDPVAMAIGMRPGEICRIDRMSKTSVTTPYYRVCTPI